MEAIEDFVADFFAQEKPPRDGSGRPLLIPRGMEVRDENRVPYTRASSLGDLLEEFSYLWKWKMRGLAKGLADSMDLIRLVAAENYTCGFAEDVSANRQAGRNIDAVIERAMDRAGISEKADYGTAVHLRTEPGNDAGGTDPDEKQESDVGSTWDLWAELGVVNIGTEIFTACDELRSAGTFDHLSYVPGLGIVVTDKKTSSKVKKTYDVQLGGYANSDIYDPETDQRMTLEEYVESKGWDPYLINREVGIIWWVKGGKTEARKLDLVQGYQAAKVAAWIRDERRTLGVAPNITAELHRTVREHREILGRRITMAESVDDVNALWFNPAARAVATPAQTEAMRSLLITDGRLDP